MSVLALITNSCHEGTSAAGPGILLGSYYVRRTRQTLLHQRPVSGGIRDLKVCFNLALFRLTYQVVSLLEGSSVHP